MLKEETVLWEDRRGRLLKSHQIDDYYLLNILHFMERGGGYTTFLSEDKIKALFNEAEERGLEHPYSVEKAVDAYYTKFQMEQIRYESHPDVLEW